MGLAPENYTYSFGTDFVENLNVYGELTGNLTGDVTGNLTGDVNAGIVTATKFVGDGADLTGIVSIPTGVIVMWSGAVSAIPSGWVLCDGNNSTPDLRSRFIVGATGDGSNNVTFDADTGTVSSNYSVNATGGSVAHQLTVAEMPSHSHSRGAIYPGGGPEQNQSGSREDSTTFNVQTGTTGGDQYHENRPPYYALAFIMKT